MSKPITASSLRANIYKVLDGILETGEIVEIERKGRRLRIVPDQGSSKLERIQPWPDLIKGDSESIADISWENELKWVTE